ncbi:glycosyltransferase family 2 protein [bacterium]|nr:glycosyltransferase family 2 protein [bacterium]
MMVSVVIATYKREQSLANALESLTNQTYKDFEVVIVDDNADVEWNKKVEIIVNKFRTSLQINYIQNANNQGSAKTRNIGINSAKGEYITFLDDDDLYLPSKIEVQVKQMIDCGADYSLMNLSLYNENETLSEIRKRDYLLTPEANDLLLCHLKHHMTGTDTMMFKKDYLVSFGGFVAIDVGDEFYLMMKAIEHNGKFVYCNACEVKAYVHTGEGGLSSGQQKIDGENRLYNFKKQYFGKLTLKNRRYVRMRHFAVLSFAYKRISRLSSFFLCGFLSFLSAPVQCCKMIVSLKRD